MAIVIIVLVEERSGHEVKVEDSVGEGGVRIKVPVSGTVADHSASNVDPLDARVKL